MFWSLFLGVGLITGGILNLPEGGAFRGFSVPAWGRWLLLFVGIAIVCLAINSVLRKKETKTAYTDKEIERAKEILDTIYLQEHGKLPPEPNGKK